MADHCTYHCRACGAHLTSLRAFDAHRQGPSDDRRCEFPDTGLVELSGGVCKLSAPELPLAAVTLYDLEATQDYRSYRQGRQAAHMQRKSGVAA